MATTLTEEMAGILHEPPLKDRTRWIAWLRQTHPALSQKEAEKEHMWRTFERSKEQS